MIDQLAIAALNFLLRRSPWGAERLKRFSGRTARLVLAPFAIDIRIGTDGLLEPALGGVPDVEIALPADAPLTALRGKDALMGTARVSGAADFADALGFVLRNLEWAAEEDLSRVFGDIIAHRLVAFGKAFTAWQADAARRLADNAAEYLQHENPQLAPRAGIESFVAAVDRLREDADRLEKRIGKLERRRPDVRPD